MQTYVHKTAAERRAEIQARASSLGIDEDYISLLVESFYNRIRKDEILGPIFAAEITGDWGPHLTKMKQFWSSVALNSGSYSGRPVPAHQKLSGISPEYFDRWLMLFRSTLEETAPSHEAIGYFMERAERIAESLKLAMFGHLEIPTRNT
ncbi:group III truncated hemoglobin [Ahrensia kielensis]|uniref:Group III truncated hemoglobin n=1 Tax=Ahrensia kielensis TaxID=76980 RepID=A0ABU9T974_9HYPH